MTREEVRAVILDIIAQIAPDEDLGDLKDNVRIRDQIELDSMDFLDIIMELRKRYGIEVPEDDYMQLATLDGAISYLQPRMDHP